MKHVLTLVLLAVAVLAQAQTAPAVASDELAPVSLTQPAPLPPPFSVQGVVVKLEENAGFNREAALTEAARKALPGVLAQLDAAPNADEAKQLAASIGNPMQFVQSYKIVKELLVPSYTLTVDLHFSQAKLESNFGRKVVDDEPPAADDTSEGLGLEDAAPAATLPDAAASREVDVVAATAAEQDRVFVALQAAGLAPQWKLITREGGIIRIATGLDGDALQQALQQAGVEVEPGTGGYRVSAP